LWSTILHFIVWDVQYGVYIEISRFWQDQGVRSSDINLARVQETGCAYKSQWEGQVRTRYNCLRMRALVQTSLPKMEWHIYVRTVENSIFFFHIFSLGFANHFHKESFTIFGIVRMWLLRAPRHSLQIE
jgi:hypothetical protein